MLASRMTPMMSRALALGLLAGVLLVLVGAVLAPFAAHLSNQDAEIETEKTTLARFRAIAALRADAAEMERQGRRAAQSEAYLKGETEALKTSALQAQLTELASGKGVRVRSARNLTARERDDLRFIGVRVQFNADVEQLRELLHAIEVTRPFLLVEGVQVQPVSYAGSSSERAGNLEVRLDVFGASARRKG